MGCSSSSEAEEPKKAADTEKAEKKEKKEKKDKGSGDDSDKKKGSGSDSDKKKKKKKKGSGSDSDSNSGKSGSSHSERGSARSAGSEHDSVEEEVQKKKEKKKEKKEKPAEEEPEEAPEEAPEEEPEEETWEPVVIAKYVGNRPDKNWKNENPHPDYQDVFTACHVDGAKGWAHGHMVLKAPGASSITATFRPPLERIKEAYPGAKWVCKVGYFAPWNMNPCDVTLKVNGEVQKANVPVKGEHKGRTHTGMVVNNLIDEEDNTITIDFNSGDGILYTWYFEFKIGPNY